MNRRFAAVFVAAFPVAAALGAAGFTCPAEAAPPAKAQAAPPAQQEAPTVPSVSLAVSRIKCGVKPTVCNYGTGPAVVFDGFRWGMTHADVTLQYSKTGGLLDQEYNADLVKMQPGREMVAKEHERDDRKRAFEASYVQFLSTPTGYDATAIKNEYTYRNKESIQSIDQRGLHRYFFYIGSPPGERLWKVYEEVRYGDESPLGRSFKDAVTAVNQILGVAGRVRAADPSQNITATTVDWQDASSRLRLVDRGSATAGVVLEDRATVNALPQLRANKGEDPFALDPSITAVTNSALGDPNATRDAGAAPAANGAGNKKKK